MRNRQYDYLFKFVIVGNSSVGKSCLLLRFADDQFSQNYMTTIGVDFRFKTLNLQNKSIKLQIWDTAGQERFRTITNTYYKNANAVLLVYDITSLDTFQDIEKYWLNQVESYADPGTQLVLVGNKCDMEKQRQVSVETAKQFAQSKNMDYFETSAKTAEHVQESFSSIARKLFTKADQAKASKPAPVQTRQKLSERLPPPQKKGCCG